MAKQQYDDALDKDSRKRLEKLSELWDAEPGWLGSEKLTFADLRLLLEHHAPLQQLIRSLAAAPPGVAPAVFVQQNQAAAEQLEQAQARLEQAQAQLHSAQADASRLQTELQQAQQKIRGLQADLQQCSSATQQLLRAKAELEQQLQHSLKAESACRAALERAGAAPPELALLRADAALAQPLGLADLPSDSTAALIQVVAVLAQRDNLERLWATLKDRCETLNRPANAAECALLQTALHWHNHTWRTRPYRLLEAAARAPYDFEQHLRSRHSSSGERIKAQHLPGIADGSGKLLCKALVSTY